ncbi:hypothetical protein V1264_021991 [Littorina saxatilis]|uniref:SAM domain-containing protein n=1 Tax=Littorina saxatilis TaxID=31220 RepID=A0AAN9AJD4_9CAEN
MANYEFIFNKKDEYTAKHLSDLYRYHLPMLVAVSRGFYGNREEMTFSTGQILRLHELRQQQRALVHDDTKNTLSVPLDYKHLFFVGGDRSESFTLRQIAEKYSLPVKVVFSDDHVHFDSDNDHSRSLVSLTIIKVHSETYFVANTIANGEPLDEVITIPFYLKQVTFCPVIGVRGQGITDGGQTVIDTLLCPQSLARVDFKKDHSDKEIVQLCRKPLKATDNIYANIETNIFISVKGKTHGGWGGRRQPQPRVTPLQGHPAQTGATSSDCDYENFNFQNKTGKAHAEVKSPELPRRPEPPVPRTSINPEPARPEPSRHLEQTSGMFPQSPGSDSDGIYEPCFDDSDSGSEDDVYEAIEPEPMSKKKLMKEQAKKAHSAERMSTPVIATALTSELEQTLQRRKQSIENIGKQTLEKVRESPETAAKKPSEDESKTSTFPFNTRFKSTKAASNLPKPSSQPSDIKAAITPSTLSATDSNDSTPSSATSGKPQKVAKPQLTSKPTVPTKPLNTTAPKPSAAKALQANIAAAATALKTQSNTLTTPATQIQPSEIHPAKASNTQNYVPATQKPAESEYVNQKEMAVVGPRSRQRTAPSPSNSQSPSPKQPSPQPPPPALQKQEKLKPLQKMSIADVMALLSRLNMTEYQTQFEEKQVDGVLLGTLTDEALKEDFNMSAVDRIKLKNFISAGHLPLYEHWPLK